MKLERKRWPLERAPRGPTTGKTDPTGFQLVAGAALLIRFDITNYKGRNQTNAIHAILSVLRSTTY